MKREQMWESFLIMNFHKWKMFVASRNKNDIFFLLFTFLQLSFILIPLLYVSLLYGFCLQTIFLYNKADAEMPTEPRVVGSRLNKNHCLSRKLRSSSSSLINRVSWRGWGWNELLALTRVEQSHEIHLPLWWEFCHMFDILVYMFLS